MTTPGDFAIMCCACGQLLNAGREGVVPVYDPPTPDMARHRRLPVPGTYHGGACADRARRVFAAGFEAALHWRKETE